MARGLSVNLIAHVLDGSGVTPDFHRHVT